MALQVLVNCVIRRPTSGLCAHNPLDFWSWAPEPTVPPNPLDQTYLHKRLHTMIGPTTVLLAAKTLFYLVLAAHVLHYRALTSKADPWLFAAFSPFVGRPGCHSYDKLLSAHLKTLTRARVAVVLVAMWATVGSGEHPIHYLLGVPFVWAVYNGGTVPPMAKRVSTGGRSTLNWSFLTWINTHHLGAVVVFAYQSTEEDPARVWHNTAFFTWVWVIHTFGFLQDWLLPRLGMPKPKGNKDGMQFKVMQAIRYAYGTASVALFHGYLMDDSMPGLGANYQTVAVLGMVIGRLLAGNSYWRIPFIKCVEAPGFAIVSVWHLSAQRRYEWAAVTVFVVGWYVRRGCLLPPPSLTAVVGKEETEKEATSPSTDSRDLSVEAVPAQKARQPERATAPGGMASRFPPDLGTITFSGRSGSSPVSALIKICANRKIGKK